jgi:hypothetical protein
MKGAPDFVFQPEERGRHLVRGRLVAQGGLRGTKAPDASKTGAAGVEGGRQETHRERQTDAEEEPPTRLLAPTSRGA